MYQDRLQLGEEYQLPAPSKTSNQIGVIAAGMLIDCNDVQSPNVTASIVCTVQCSTNITALSFEHSANTHSNISELGNDYGLSERQRIKALP